MFRINKARSGCSDESLAACRVSNESNFSGRDPFIALHFNSNQHISFVDRRMVNVDNFISALWSTVIVGKVDPFELDRKRWWLYSPMCPYKTGNGCSEQKAENNDGL